MDFVKQILSMTGFNTLADLLFHVKCLYLVWVYLSALRQADVVAVVKNLSLKILKHVCYMLDTL